MFLFVFIIIIIFAQNVNVQQRTSFLENHAREKQMGDHRCDISIVYTHRQ